MVQQAVAGTQQLPGTIVRRTYPPAPIELNDPAPGGGKEFVERRTQGSGVGQRLADAHVVADVRQEPPDQFDLPGRPAAGVNRIIDHPDDARPAGSVQTHVDAVLGVTEGQRLVVGRGALQLFVGVEVPAVDQSAVRQLPKARDAFIRGVVVVKVPALPFRIAFAAIVEPGVEDPHIPTGLVGAHHQRIALRTERVVDEGGCGWPALVVECGLVQ